MDSFDEAWELIYGFCRSQLSEVAFTTWFSRMRPLSLDLEKGEALIEVPNQFHKNTIEKCFLELIYDGFFQVFQGKVKFTLVSAEDLEAQRQQEEQDKLMAGNGDDKLTFENFVVGPSNRFAHAASLAVATRPAQLYNPLFIYGHSGLGKTHLLYAIMNDVQASHKRMKMVYVKGDDFTNEVIEGIGRGTMAALREKYRQADLLLVDDVHFIAGKNSTQEEFFHTFNTLYEGKKQIVLTSDRPPKEMPTLDERLRTRFEWGLLADIQPPDFETRIVIILSKAQSLGITIPDNVCEYMATKLRSNVRQIEGAVKKLKAYHMLESKPINVTTAQSAISDVINSKLPAPVTLERVLEEVSRTFSVPAGDILSQKRNAAVSSARQAAIYIMREITPMSMVEIGKAFGGRDHSTVVYAVHQMELAMKKDIAKRDMVQEIIKNLQTD